MNKPEPYSSKSATPAANIARTKIEQLHSSGSMPNYRGDKPGLVTDDRSKAQHQSFIHSLMNSGKSQAEIQTEWHTYYQGLSDREKHEVWQEFYKAQSDAKAVQNATKQPVASSASTAPSFLSKATTKSSHSRRKAHFQSLIFGLGMGLVVVFILMFSFFNERIVTPFIRPGQNVSATPIIVDPNNMGPVGKQSKIVIPKINIEAPIVFDEPSVDEKAIQKALERGVVHYAITPLPGELGNSVIVGHSSSNILNSGKYKFAFLLLKSLESGDTFIVQNNGKRYVYKVYNKFVTNPKDVSVLGPPPKSKKAIMTLITCDPPGMSTNRLIIQGEQIYPDPGKNTQSSVTPESITSSEPEELPSNAPSLWSRFVDSIFN